MSALIITQCCMRVKATTVGALVSIGMFSGNAMLLYFCRSFTVLPVQHAVR